jgi:hypothetical protein
MKYNIYKVKDKTDSYYTEKKDNLFDIPFKILIIGKSHLSGKTTIVLNYFLLPEYYGHDFKGDNIFVVSNNELDNKIKIFMDEKDIPTYNRMPFDEGVLADLYDQLEEEFKDEVDAKQKPSNKLVIMDDVAYSGALKAKKTGVVNRFFFNGRHMNCSICVTSQKYSLLENSMRENATGIVLFNCSNQQLELIEHDCNFLSDKRSFIKMFRTVVQDKRDFLIINFGRPCMYYDKAFNCVNPECHKKCSS